MEKERDRVQLSRNPQNRTESEVQQYQMDTPPLQRKEPSLGDDTPDQFGNGAVQLKAKADATTLPPMQRKGSPRNGGVSNSISQLKKNGGPGSEGKGAVQRGDGMPAEVLEKMEMAFKADFSQVVFKENSAKAVQAGALAFASGNEVHFAPGQFSPNSPKGQELIGHELAHVIQQREGRVQPTAMVGDISINDDLALEAEADKLGALAAKGQNASMGSPGSAVESPVVQKKVELDARTFSETTVKAEEKTSKGPEKPTIDQKAPDAKPKADPNKQQIFGPGFSQTKAVAEQESEGEEEAMEEAVEVRQLKTVAQLATAPAAPAAKEGVPATVLDITSTLEPKGELLEYFKANHNKYVTVNAKIGSIAKGQIEVRQTKKPKDDGSGGKYEIKANQGLEYTQGVGFLEPLKAKGLIPVIGIKHDKSTNAVTGVLTLKVGDKVVPEPNSLIDIINEHLEPLGLLGVEQLKKFDYENKVEGGVLTLMAPEFKTKIGKHFDVTGKFGRIGNEFVFEMDANVEVGGIANGQLHIERTEEGKYNGELEIAVEVENVTGNVKVVYLDGKITGRGTGAIESEKFSGEITLIFDEKAKADAAVHDGLGLSLMEESEAAPAEAQTDGPRVLAGFGTVKLQLTDWLSTTAHVGIDSEGHVTVHGELEFPDQVELMEQKDKKHDLFDVEIKAGYGIPLVGQVFLFASLGMFVKAGFGPLALRNIGMEGTYSTDPKVLQNFKITGSLGISAYAQVGLSVKAGVGLTLLGHDVKAGIDLSASAGVQAYAEATPTFEYFEKQEDGQKVGEAHLKGHFEAAARLFLELAGAFFVELDSPWWSPAPDKKWEWPFGSLVYPLGENMGVGADVDWLVGSPEAPELQFSPVQFDPDKFISDMTKEPDNFGEKGKGGDEKKDGTWQDGNAPTTLTKDGPQADPNAKKDDKPKEDLSKLSDEEKYMRALGEVGDIGDAAKSKPIGSGALKKKLKQIQSKYGVGSITSKPSGEGLATVLVTHKDQNNKNNPIEVKLLSGAELKKQLDEAKADLETALKTLGHPETGAITKSQAEAIAHENDLGHEVIDGTKVTVEGEEVVIYGEVEGKWTKLIAKPLLKGMEDEPAGKKKEEEEQGKAENEVQSEEDLTDADRELNKKVAKSIIKEFRDSEKSDDETVSTDVFYEAKKALSEKLRDKYLPQLRKGLELDVDLEAMQASIKDGNIDLKVRIHPNDTVEEWRIKYPEASNLLMIGKHPIENNGRHSHHVPPNELKSSIARFYGAVASSLSGKEDFKDLQDKLAKKQETIESTYDGHGNNLSAISLAPNTHLGEEAVHSSEIQEPALKKIKTEVEEEQKERVVVFVKSGKRMVANLNKPHWEKLIKQVYEIEKAKESKAGQNIIDVELSADQLIIKVVGGDSNGLSSITSDLEIEISALIQKVDQEEEETADQMIAQKKLEVSERVENTNRRVFEDTLNNECQKVAEALSRSTSDGNHEAHPGAIKELKSTARVIWKPIIEI